MFWRQFILKYTKANLCGIVALISLKMIIDSTKNRRWIIPFKKNSRLRVKQYGKLCLLVAVSVMSIFFALLNPYPAEFLKWTYPCLAKANHFKMRQGIKKAKQIIFSFK